MSGKRNKLLSLILSLAMVVTLTAGIATTAYAASTFSIDGTAGHTWADFGTAITLYAGDKLIIDTGAGDPATDIPITIAGDATISGDGGTFDNLHIIVNAGVTLTINDLNLDYSGVRTALDMVGAGSNLIATGTSSIISSGVVVTAHIADSTITVPNGANSLTIDKGAAGMTVRVSGTANFDISGTGMLYLKNTGGTSSNGVFSNDDSVINKSGNGIMNAGGGLGVGVNCVTLNVNGGTLNASSTGNDAVLMRNPSANAINVAAGAALNAVSLAAGYSGVSTVGSASLTVSNLGTLTAAGNDMNAFIGGSPLVFNMGAGATTTLANGDTVIAETHDFTMTAGTPAGSQWAFGAGALFAGGANSTSNPAQISVGAGFTASITLNAPSAGDYSITIGGTTTNYFWAPGGGTINLLESDVMTILSANSPAAATTVSIAANANVTINGNGTMINNLCIAETGTGATVNINNLQITAPAGQISYTQSGGTLVLTGANKFVGSSGTACFGAIDVIAITSSNNGTLIATGNNQTAINLSLVTGTLNILGNAAVTAIGGANSNGVFAANINIDNGASLTATGTTKSGIQCTGNLTVTNKGRLSATGGATYPAIYASGTTSINMGAGATTTLTNNDLAAEVHSFTMAAGVPAGSEWQLTSASFVAPGTVTSSPANITVGAGQTGTIKLYDPTTPVCKIVDTGVQYTTLGGALAAVTDGETIKLLANITVTSGIYINRNASFTIDPDAYTLDFNGNFLDVSNSADVTFTDADSLLNLAYVEVSGTVSAAAFTGDLTLWSSSNTIVCYSGSLTVTGSVIANNVAPTNFAVKCFDGGKVNISGSLTSGGSGIYASDAGSAVTLGGDVTVPNGKGIDAENGAVVTVNGGITMSGDVGVSAQGSGTNITVSGNVTAKGTGIEASGEATVTVGTAATPGSVTSSIDGNGVYVTGTSTAVIVNGNVTASGSYNYGVNADGGAITVTGSVTAPGDHCDAIHTVGDATVTVGGNVTAANSGSWGICAESGTVSVGGSVAGDDIGVYARDSGTNVTVNGNVSATDKGIDAKSGSAVTVGTAGTPGSVTSTNNDGVYATGANTKVTLYGDVSAVYTGIGAENGAQVTVTGDVSSSGNNSTGIYAADNDTKVIVNGDVKAFGHNDAGVGASNGCTVTVNGSVAAADCIAVAADGAGTKVTVNGNIEAGDPSNSGFWAVCTSNGAQVAVTGNITANDDGDGVYANSGSTVTVGGNIISTGTSGVGVWAELGATVTVDGTITVGAAGDYICTNSTTYNKTDNAIPPSASCPAGYLEYTDGDAYVWVKAPIAPTITGPTAMTLTAGYTATSTGVYTVTGTAPVTVTKTSGNAAITWNNTTMKLDIAAGLTAGTYPVVLTASNGTLPNATLTFTLTVKSSTPGGGGTTTTYTVTFNSNGGSAVASQSVASGGKAAKPANPKKDGFVFAGWYSDSGLTSAYDFSNPVTGNITLYAKWAETAVTPPPTDQGWKNPFVDVKSGDWFYGDVEYVCENGLMNGTASNLFSPNIPTSRAMIVTILYRQEGSPSVAGLANPFSDVPAGQWYTDAVIWAAKNGIVTGYGNGKFGPDDKITRQDLAVILYRYADFAGIPLPVTQNYIGFKDDADIANYAKDAVETFFKAGIINGKPGNVFDPQGQATRAEAAAMLHRFLEAEE